MKILDTIYKIRQTVTLRQKRIIHLAMILLVGAAVYANSIHGPFVLDDYGSIEYFGKKDLLKHLLNGSSRRVADITFAFNYRIHGLHVAGYHLTNLAIHLLTSIFLYFIVISAISALRVSYHAKESATEQTSLIDQFVPFAIALLFIIHPVQTQAVTYIIQRYTSLSSMFYLLSALFFVRARLVLERSGSRRSFWLLVAGTVVSGALAFGSKQIAVTLPLMLLLLEFFLFRGRLINRRFFIACGLLFLMAAAVVLVKWQSGSLNDFLFDLRHATSEDLFTSRTNYFLTQTRVVVTYLSLLCLPIGQSLVHDATIYTTLFTAPVIASLSLHIFLFATAVALFKMSGRNLANNAWQRGVYQRLASLGIIWFYLAMSVESSFIPIRDIIFEHRIYLPSAGFFMTIIAVTALAVQGRRAGIKVAWMLLVVTSVILGSMTIARNHIWSDPLALWQDAASKSPNNWLALANLAGTYLDRRMPVKALPLYVRTLELNPSAFIKTKVALGDTLKAMNIFESRFTTGQEYILPGGIFDTGNLDYKNMSKCEAVISNNLGLAYEYLKKPEQAVHAYKIALTLNPAYDLALYNLALLAAKVGEQMEFDEALRQLSVINPALARTVNLNLVGVIPR